MNKLSIQKLSNIIGVVGAVSATLVAVATPVQAQEKAAAAQTGPIFGSVNVQQIVAEAKARQRDEAEMRQLAATLRASIQQLQENAARFLPEAEIRELAALYEKPMPTEVDKKRKTALEDKASAVNVEKRKIENNPSPTDDIRKRYAELSDIEQRSQQVLQSIQADYERRIDARNTESMNKVLADTKTIIAKIAQEKKLSVVFDSNVAIYTANDITAEVVKQLNK